VNTEHAEKAALHGFRGIVDEIGERAPDGIAICHHRGKSRFEDALNGNAFETSSEKSECVFGNLIHIAGTRLGRGKLRECRELVDESSKSSNAGEDDFTALTDNRRRVGLATIEMPADAFCGKCDGGEGVLDFVRYPLSDFFPGDLPLGAKEFRGVFDDEDCSRAVAGQLEPSAGDGEMKVAPAYMEFDFSGCGTHALTPTNDARKFIENIRRKNRIKLLALEASAFILAHEDSEGAIGLEDRSRGVECDDARGDVFENDFQLAAAFLNGLVGSSELGRRRLSKLAAGVEVFCHVIEGTDEFGHFARSDEGNAVFIFACGNFVHCVRESFDRTGDLLGKKECEPHA
jgi:hypothetical protein